jgi:hypothetical protein
MKKPLCFNQQGKNSELKTNANIGSRKHAVPFDSLFFRLPVAAEGRFERLLRQFHHHK